MLNMNSPTVQNLIQSGFNPYNNTGYVPQQPIQQNTYYNPYIIQQPQSIDNGNFYYDPMPKVIVNESRGINSNISQSNKNSSPGLEFSRKILHQQINPIVRDGKVRDEYAELLENKEYTPESIDKWLAQAFEAWWSS